MDQIAANALKRETQLSSLQLTVDDNSLVGSCDVGYSCAYSSTLSWLTPTLPLMAENNPRVVFERLFGSSDSTDPRVRAVAAPSGSKHSRFGDRAREAAPADARRRGQHEGERLSRVVTRRGAADPEGRGTARDERSRTSISLPACRTGSSRTCSCSTICSCSPISPISRASSRSCTAGSRPAGRTRRSAFPSRTIR